MKPWSAPKSLPTENTVHPAVRSSLSPLRLFDTSRSGVFPLAPEKTLQMYVCGITPYDATHLGHAATYLTFDIVNRVVRSQGFGVNYVQNITDIDDPLFERARRDKKSWQDIANAEVDLFRSDMEALAIIPPESYVAVTESIDIIRAKVQDLLDQGLAYYVNNDGFQDIYCRSQLLPNFGYISHLTSEAMETLFAQRGGDPDNSNKEHPLDDLLWKATREGEPSWDAPFGNGRPGWHIECTAISSHYCQLPVDIQGGGCDLQYPHHEYSAAHVESTEDVDRFARFYVHAGMIGYQGEKMSKSLGNLIKVSVLCHEGVDPATVRLALLRGHYRQDRMFEEKQLIVAQENLDRIREVIHAKIATDGALYLPEMGRYVSDDLHTDKALDILDSWIESSLHTRKVDCEATSQMQSFVTHVLGLTI